MLRVGVIGAGLVGVRHLRALRRVPEVAIAGVFDADMLRAQQVASAYRTRAFTSLDACLGRVDAVTIATAVAHRSAFARRAIEAGVHVMIEAPAHRKAGEARRLIALGRSLRICVVVASSARRNPVLAELRAFLRGKRPRSITYRHALPAHACPAGVDAIDDLLTPGIEAILHLVGGPIDVADAVAVPATGGSIGHVAATLRLPHVPDVTAVASCGAEREVWTVDTRVSDAWMSADLRDGHLELARLGVDGDVWPRETNRLGGVERDPADGIDAHEAVLQHFVGSVLGRSEPEPWDDDAAAPLVAGATIHAIVRQRWAERSVLRVAS